MIVVLQEYKIKRCLKLLFLHLRRKTICTILGDLCKLEAAFIAGLDFTRANQEDIRTFYDREPELEKKLEHEQSAQGHKELNMVRNREFI